MAQLAPVVNIKVWFQCRKNCTDGNSVLRHPISLCGEHDSDQHIHKQQDHQSPLLHHIGLTLPTVRIELISS